jgi:hypothetical protein
MPRVTNTSSHPVVFFARAGAGLQQQVTLVPGETEELDVVDANSAVFQAWVKDGTVKLDLSDEDVAKFAQEGAVHLANDAARLPGNVRIPNLAPGFSSSTLAPVAQQNLQARLDQAGPVDPRLAPQNAPVVGPTSTDTPPQIVPGPEPKPIAAPKPAPAPAAPAKS